MSEEDRMQSSGSVAGVATPDINNMSVHSEEVPSLADYGREPSGIAWPDGWYKAEVIEGYATGSGFQWETGDKASKDGQSRNMTVCFVVTNREGENKNIWYSFNYRLNDFDPKRIAAVVELRKQYAGKKGAWAEKDFQRTSLAIASLGQFERALGFRLRRTPAGNLIVRPFFAQKMDVRMRTNDEGYNDVAEFAKLDERTGKAAKGKKSA